ncbi:YrzI family small protein [Bacillus timonensis]|uniref:YrzI family small protein n=1 Tax=Bacillus timonensis TaxID=1033734 RepID=A0A4S3Q0I1_9BACI|nr:MULTISPECIES: YrzI family small protein [Bacillaceae]MDR4889033.1 YrzI family small protein [Fredinandcohnia sp. QZ13]RFB17609.1 YrzI family small protein [Bacillus sp. HNG]THE15376.1 YrzI family small protein [Bacillus timonensis]
MTINLFFLTISISKREKSIEEYQREERVNKLMEEMKERQYSMMRLF